jgi:MSHA biogenesis protein MshI
LFSLFKKKSKGKVVGLEIRSSGIALAISSASAGAQSRIDVCEYKECNAAERESVLAEFVEKYDLAGCACRVALPADQYRVYPLEKPKVEESELVDAVRWKLKDILDYDVNDAVIDVYDFPSDALKGRPEQVNVVATRAALIQDTVNLVSKTDLELLSIDISELAIRNVALRLSEEAQRSIAVLYLRHGSGMIVLVKGDTLYFSRNFDFSLQALNDVSQQNSVIQQLALEVQRSFDYFESQMAQVPPQTVMLMGPAPNMPLANMLGGNIAAQVESIDMAGILQDDMTVGLNEIQAFTALCSVLREE